MNKVVHQPGGAGFDANIDCLDVAGLYVRGHTLNGAFRVNHGPIMRNSGVNRGHPRNSKLIFSNCESDKYILPYLLENGGDILAFEYNGI